MNLRRLLVATVTLPLIALPFAGRAQEGGTTGYEDPAPLEVARLLPEAVIRSAQHQVTGVQAVPGNRVVFEIESEIAGTQRVESIPLALIRIREILTLSQARSQIALGNPAVPDENRGQIRVQGDSIGGILFDPFTTGGKVIGQFGANVGQTLNELGTFPWPDGPTSKAIGTGQNSSDPVFESHRRNIASQLGLDVYSSNLQVQFFLDSMATARINGQQRAGIATISLNQPVRTSIDGGQIESRIRTSILNRDRSELYQRNEGLLQEAGIDENLISDFMATTTTTLTHKTVLAEYLAYLKDVGRREALIQAALTANNEVDALATIATVRMYALYHESWSPLKELISAGHLTLGISQDGTLLVALPFDILFWNRGTEVIFEALRGFAEDKGILKKAVLLMGAATANARQSLEQMGFQTLGRFLFKR